MNINYGHNYEQEDPGWYLYDEDTGLVIASTLNDVSPTPKQLKHINQHKHLSDIYDLILQYIIEEKQ